MNEPYNSNQDEDDEEEYIYKKQSHQKEKKNYPHLNFFQDDFSKPQNKQQKEQEEKQTEKGQVLQEFTRRQAFMNFRKSEHTLNANKGDGIQVKYHGGQQPSSEQQTTLQEAIIQVKTFQIKSAFQSKSIEKKSVSINLEQNQIFNFVKSRDEYLTMEEKMHLAERVQMHRFGIMDYSDDEEDQVEEQDPDDLLDDLLDEDQDDNQNVQPHWKNEQDDEIEIEDQEQEDFIITKENIQELRQRRTFIFEKKKLQVNPKIPKPLVETQKKIKTNNGHSDQDFKKTYDKGYEMLKKMGFKAGAGLGKDEQGIQKPIQAVMKKSLQGGQGPLIDISTEEIEIPEKNKSKKVSKKMKKLEKQWKRNKSSHPKGQTELIDLTKKSNQINLSRGAMVRKVEIGDQQVDTLKIVDMTGSNTIMYNNLQNFLVSKSNDELTIDVGQNQYYSQKESYQESFQQLSNISLSLQDKVDKLVNKISRYEINIKSERDKIVMFQFEKSQKDEQMDQYVREVGLRKTFLVYLEKLNVYFEENNEDTITTLDKFITLFHSNKDDFIQFNVYTLCLKIIGESIDKRLITWSGPHSSQAEDQLNHELKAIVMVTQLLKDVFLHKKAQSIRKYSKNLGQATNVILSNQKISSGDVRVLKRFTSYLVKNIISKLRKFIVNEWVPEEERDFYLLDFLEGWTKTIVIAETDDIDSVKNFISAIAKEQENEIIEQLILPRLNQSIDRWTYKGSDGAFLHLWLLPWYIYIKQNDEKKLIDLNKIIVAKLSQTFQHWKPQQSWGFHCIQPWKRFLEESKWDNLMLRAVLPKLMHTLMTDFKINPADQDISLIDISISWSEILSDEQVTIIFEQCVFQEIENVLVVWKEHGGDLQEINLWLKGWEHTLKNVIQRLPKFKGFFNSLHKKL